jgi:replicative DNA helicase
MNAVLPLTSDRPEPCNYDAEKAYLAAVLKNNEVWHQRADALRAEHFADPLHARIYETVSFHIKAGRIANPPSLLHEFKDDAALLQAGGPMYLVELAESVVVVVGASDYADIIIDLARRRSLAKTFAVAVSECKAGAPSITADGIVEKVESEFAALSDADGRKSSLVSGAAAVQLAIGSAEAAYKAGGVGGLPTGLTDLDRATGGLHAPDLIIMAGRPGMGKTALATTIALAAAKRNRSVGFFTLEMSSEQQGQRIISMESGITAERLRRGILGQGDFEILTSVASEMETLPLSFDDDPMMTVDRMVTKAKRLKRTRGLDLIVIDYLQLVHGRKGASMYERVTELSGGVKAMAKLLHVPVLCLSQLSRAVEGRDDKRPQLSDLRESGAIEQDADSVWFAYREAYYLERSEPKPKSDEDMGKFSARLSQHQSRLAAVKNIGEVIVSKNRHGPLSTVQLHFDGPRAKFANLQHGAVN